MVTNTIIRTQNGIFTIIIICFEFQIFRHCCKCRPWSRLAISRTSQGTGGWDKHRTEKYSRKKERPITSSWWSQADMMMMMMNNHYILWNEVSVLYLIGWTRWSQKLPYRFYFSSFVWKSNQSSIRKTINEKKSVC